eukprot:365416-Chlamydomonas_euryale.AAC.8
MDRPRGKCNGTLGGTQCCTGAAGTSIAARSNVNGASQEQKWETFMRGATATNVAKRWRW